jgi:hypothetical protein
MESKTMPCMTPTPRKTIVFPEALQSAIDDHCAKAGVDFSTFVRQAAAEKVGNPALAETRPEGRPKLPPRRNRRDQ